jgi:hypothetical protein
MRLKIALKPARRNRARLSGADPDPRSALPAWAGVPRFGRLILMGMPSRPIVSGTSDAGRAKGRRWWRVGTTRYGVSLSRRAKPRGWSRRAASSHGICLGERTEPRGWWRKVASSYGLCLARAPYPTSDRSASAPGLPLGGPSAIRASSPPVAAHTLDLRPPPPPSARRISLWMPCRRIVGGTSGAGRAKGRRWWRVGTTRYGVSLSRRTKARGWRRRAASSHGICLGERTEPRGWWRKVASSYGVCLARAAPGLAARLERGGHHRKPVRAARGMIHWNRRAASLRIWPPAVHPAQDRWPRMPAELGPAPGPDPPERP